MDTSAYSKYSEYMDDVNNSEGFYVTPSRDGSEFPGGIRHVGDYSGDDYRKAKCAAVFAVEEHNKKEGEKGLLEFKRIVNLNVEPAAGAIYYITMAAADVSGKLFHYQAKVWKKINTGYQVLIFRLAPYWLKFSVLAEDGIDICFIEIDNLMPWMNESYIYYKCFYRFRNELLGVLVIHEFDKGASKGFLWFKNCAESKEILKKYAGKRMPNANELLYDFDLKTCFRNFLI